MISAVELPNAHCRPNGLSDIGSRHLEAVIEGMVKADNASGERASVAHERAPGSVLPSTNMRIFLRK